MKISITEAKTRLSELVAAAESGKEVIITRRGKPAVRMVPILPRKRLDGQLEGIIVPGTIPDFLEAMSEEDLKEWE